MNQWPYVWEQIKMLIYTAPAALLALSVHEACHGYASYLLGDPTPKSDGRLSLNPLHHLDLFGTICIVIFHFGWAKPVMVNPRYYKKPKLGMALTALAGPLSNLILAFFSLGLFAGLTNLGWWQDAGFTEGASSFAEGLRAYLYLLVRYLGILNIGLGVFNLIPIPPLDGSKIFGALLPDRLYFQVMKYERYGSLLLLALLYIGILDGPLGAVRSWITQLFLRCWMWI